MPAEANTIKTLFLTALEKETPAERSAYLDKACEGDAKLRKRIEAMLRAHDQPDPLLDQSAADHLVVEDERELSDILEPPTKPGTLGRLGHYEVREVVGRGGMGIVLKAFDEKLLRVVAIKLLAPALAGSGEARKRFVREARAAASVTHDNVIGIHEVEDGGRIPYLVMQFVGGRTLQQKLDRTGPLPLKEILRIGLQIAEGLAAAHRQGLIHRDIKPANVLLENGIERVKITDFGLARAADDVSLTQSGHVAGTPSYMSPEQANGARVDYRSDLFSLGSVLYALCAGHPPFLADSAVAILRHVCDDTPRPLREMNPDIPEWMEAAIAKLLAKKPEDRFASATEVATLLSRRLAQLQSGVEPSSSIQKLELSRKPSLMRQMTRGKVLLTIALVLLLAGTATWLLTRNPQANPPSGPGDTPTTKTPTTTKPDIPPAPAKPVVLQPVQTLRKHASDVLMVAFSPNGKTLASGGQDSTIVLWDTDTWLPRATLTGHKGPVEALAFSPDSGRLASVTSSGDECFVRLWNVATAKSEGTLGGRVERGLFSVDWSSDGKLVACGGWGGDVTVWDVASREERLKIRKACPDYVRILSFSPKGDVIVSGGTGRTKLWDVKTGHEIPSDFPEWMCPHFLPSGDAVAGWLFYLGRVVVCDVPSGRLRHSWQAHPNHIEGMAVSPDGRYLASTGNDGLAHVWVTADDQNEVAKLPGHRGTVGAAAFSPDGKLLATCGKDGTIRIWELPSICHVQK
jgi:serine/threonine protein kinase